MNIIAIILIISPPSPPLPVNPEPLIYTQKTSKRSLNVLKLYPDNTYNFCRYKTHKIQRDTGTYLARHKRLKFKSSERRHAFNPLTQRTAYKGRKGIYLKTIKGILGGTPDFFTANHADYLKQPWNYNPITQKLEELAVSPPKKLQKPANNHNSIEAAKQYFVNTTQEYAAGYHRVLLDAYSGPGLYNTYVNGQYVPWNQDTSHKALFREINTVVHESVHHYNQDQYLIIPGITIPVSKTEVCKSEGFGQIAPKDITSQIFRYSLYVSKGSVVSANQSGIYGIMDEFSAYMNGTRASLMAAQKSMANGSSEEAELQMKETGKTYFAWYEFRLFTAWYLHYTHLNQRDIYNKIMENNNLRLAFTLIDDEYENVIQQAKQICINNNCEAWQNFISQYNKFVEPCKKALRNEEKWLTDFRLQGVNMHNYRDYLTPGLTASN